MALQLVGTGPTTNASTSVTPTAGTGASGIVSLPVVAALLKAGSQTPVSDGASTTFVDLRGAAQPDQLVSGTQPATLPTTTPSQPVFVTTTTQNGKQQGHTIPAALWAYITRPDISPAGWQSDIGVPLTEAQTLTVTQSGATHHLLVQVFWHAVLVADVDTLSSDKPTIARTGIGLDYLLTLGPPTVAFAANTAAWALGAAAVLDAAVSGNETVHIRQNYPLTLTGDSKWSAATLWYAVSWSAGAKSHGTGWFAGAAVTFAAPDPAQPGQASFDTLSSDLANYLATRGKNMGVAVYDITRNTYYAYNDTAPFYLASTAKVYIMSSYLDYLEGQGRSPNSGDLSELTAMIEHSDNNAAQLLYDRVGGIPGAQHFLQKIGITDYVSCVYGWGCAQLSAGDAVHILTLLQEGKILNDSDRKLAFTLMGNIESDQQWGVGDTAPKGATYYMKDGWLQYPDDPWDLNSVGIVSLNGETYAIAVYSENNLSFDWSKVEHVCATVGQLLTAS
jgi:beta-lactamase class A